MLGPISFAIQGENTQHVQPRLRSPSVTCDCISFSDVSLELGLELLMLTAT